MNTTPTLEARYLDEFQAWLRTLGTDAVCLTALLEPSVEPSLRRAAARSLTYLFKSIDLIPDGLEELGYLDDAFVLRVALASSGGSEREGWDEAMTGLAAGAELIRDFLGVDYLRLEAYVARLDSAVARGRSVEGVLSDPELASALATQTRTWAGEYPAPAFTRDEKSLVKLRAFFATKLPGL